ncbi:MAG: sugar transferase [Nocardioides alkalitolerans]
MPRALAPSPGDASSRPMPGPTVARPGARRASAVAPRRRVALPRCAEVVSVVAVLLVLAVTGGDLRAAVVLGAAWAVARGIVGVTRPHPALSSTDLTGVATSGLVALGVLVLADAVLPGVPTSERWAPLVLLVAVVVVVRSVAGVLRGRPRALVLVDPDDLDEVTATERDVRVVGRLPVERRTGRVMGSAARFTDTPLAHEVAEKHADIVLVDPGLGLGADGLRQLTWELQPTGVPLGFPAPPVAPHRMGVGRLAGRGIVSVAPPQASRARAVAKGVLDRVLGAVALVLVAPVLLVLALAVRADSPGPAFFRQVRVGRDGVPFVMVKLRTMTVDAEVVRADVVHLNDSDAVLFKIRADPRVTRVGRVLRRTSLDELPQLWNVVRGEMSLVGPRPALPEEVAAYDETERRRLRVKPGLTGLWQVSGRSDLSWATSVDLDLTYTDNHTIAGDLVICARTVSAVLRGKGAY